ncbi:MAG: DUF4173 domain-containing protein [Oscillospiraceae bacterium]|nr:DUF4173 domain-containing protein [Oscillospiraceae bacterium]
MEQMDKNQPENTAQTPIQQNESEGFIFCNPSVNPYVQARPVKPEWKLKTHDLVFAWLSLVLGFLFMRYIVVYADGFVTTGVFLLLYLFSAVYIRRTGCKPKLPHHILGAVICGFSTVFSLTSNPLLHGLNFIFLMLAIIWRTHAVCGEKGFVSRFFPFDLSDSVFASPAFHFSAGPQAISDSVKKSSAATNVKTVLLGLLITIPLTVVVAALLSSADSGVEHLLNNALNHLTNDVTKTIFELGCGIPVGLWLFAVLYSAAQRKLHPNPMPEDAVYEEKLAGLRMLPNLGLYAGVTPICLLYIVYVCSQTTYFLSAFAGHLPEDTIYSEYARRGFFELCAIAVINLIVILVLTGCAKKGGKNRPKALTFYAVVLCLFTLFIIATALAKMVLYIDAYGLTSLRLYTAWFMVLLTVVFLVLLVRQFVSKLPTAAILTGSFIVLFGVLCFSRPDARIAEYNIMRYEQKTLPDLDVNMLCGLSDDAYVVMAKHPETLVDAEKWDYFWDQLTVRTNLYHSKPDTSWNLTAQILIQQCNTDTGHGKLENYCTTTEAAQ